MKFFDRVIARLIYALQVRNLVYSIASTSFMGKMDISMKMYSPLANFVHFNYKVQNDIFVIFCQVVFESDLNNRN